MSRGVQLQTMLTNLRVEIGHSSSSALGQNVREALVEVLQRTQKQLWEDHDWPFLYTKQLLPLQAGQRYYNLPSVLTLERVYKIYIKEGGVWRLLHNGIGAKEYNLHDSDIDERSDPARAWEGYGSNQIEIWPIPETNGVVSTFEGYIRVEGIQNLSTFVSNTDTADLDDTLLVLHAAAEWLARQKSSDADAKFQLATKHYNRLKNRLRKKTTVSLVPPEPMYDHHSRPPRVE